MAEVFNFLLGLNGIQGKEIENQVKQKYLILRFVLHLTKRLRFRQQRRKDRVLTKQQDQKIIKRNVNKKIAIIRRRKSLLKQCLQMQIGNQKKDFYIILTIQCHRLSIQGTCRRIAFHKPENGIVLMRRKIKKEKIRIQTLSKPHKFNRELILCLQMGLLGISLIKKIVLFQKVRKRAIKLQKIGTLKKYKLVLISTNKKIYLILLDYYRLHLPTFTTNTQKDFKKYPSEIKYLILVNISTFLEITSNDHLNILFFYQITIPIIYTDSYNKRSTKTSINLEQQIDWHLFTLDFDSFQYF